MSIRSAAYAAALFSLTVTAHADLHYRVTIRPEQRLMVSIQIPVTNAVTQIQSPNWGPGSYVLRDNWKNVEDFKVTGDGKEITPAKPNDYTWTIPSAGVKMLTVTYTVPVNIVDEIGHYRGPASYAYVVGRTQEKCDLAIDVPQGWNIATGLDMKKGLYVAPTYDVLADNPVTFGKYRQIDYKVLGKTHSIVLYGTARNELDDAYLTKACTYIAQIENDFFGNRPPYSHYVWHFDVGRRADGGGGLEHLSSTEITLANGLGPGIIGVNAHEFFHLWNVKRIRSNPLGPFDYTKLPETGALWWLEGVTDYFAHQLMSRYGFWDDKKFFTTMASQVRGVRAKQERMEVGPYEASFRVKDAANGRGNSDGYKVSYYNTGFVVGACLDIELITRTNGKRSLDDVEHALWDLCKDNKPGFAEDEIRKQLIRFGGSAMGDVYDQLVMKPGELPVEAELAKVGLKMATVDRTNMDIGVIFNAVPASGGLTVTRAFGPAADKLKQGDIILQINGEPVPTQSAYTATVAKLTADKEVSVKIKRGEETLDVMITPRATTRQVLDIFPDPAATPEQLKMRDIWVYRGKKNWKPKG